MTQQVRGALGARVRALRIKRRFFIVNHCVIIGHAEHVGRRGLVKVRMLTMLSQTLEQMDHCFSVRLPGIERIGKRFQNAALPGKVVKLVGLGGGNQIEHRLQV